MPQRLLKHNSVTTLSIELTALMLMFRTLWRPAAQAHQPPTNRLIKTWKRRQLIWTGICCLGMGGFMFGPLVLFRVDRGLAGKFMPDSVINYFGRDDIFYIVCVASPVVVVAAMAVGVYMHCALERGDTTRCHLRWWVAVLGMLGIIINLPVTSFSYTVTVFIGVVLIVYNAGRIPKPSPGPDDPDTIPDTEVESSVIHVPRSDSSSHPSPYCGAQRYLPPPDHVSSSTDGDKPSAMTSHYSALLVSSTSSTLTTTPTTSTSEYSPFTTTLSTDASALSVSAAPVSAIPVSAAPVSAIPVLAFPVCAPQMASV